MKMDTAIIYDASGSTGDRIVRQRPDGTLTIILLGKGESIEAITHELLEQGIRRVELCGGMPTADRAKATALALGKARVSGVTFGIEAITPAAAFNTAYMDGRPPKEALIILEGGGDPVAGLITRHFPPQHITIVPVPDEASAAGIAAALAEDGVGLIELYGDFTAVGAAMVIKAVDGRAAVGASSFTVEMSGDV